MTVATKEYVQYCYTLLDSYGHMCMNLARDTRFWFLSNETRITLGGQVDPLYKTS